MKAKKLLERVKQFLDADRHTQLDKIRSIRKVLKELKEKERMLREQLEHEKDSETKESLQLRLDVIYAQRKKGVDRVQELKEGLKSKEQSTAETDISVTDAGPDGQPDSQQESQPETQVKD
ncbi:hypothetical protein [Nitrincola schmidtii]|uniref:hypothetical protein n=1 Tax=Nitrincola schmidtii TaxID=1730894 RepID=UPI00197F2E8E|nr:hypothetical protein [Nitrincola schmidtii]